MLKSISHWWKALVIKSYFRRIKTVRDESIVKGKRINEKYYLAQLRKMFNVYEKRIKTIQDGNAKEIKSSADDQDKEIKRLKDILQKELKRSIYIYEKKEKKLENKTKDVFELYEHLRKRSNQLDNLINEVQMADTRRLKTLHDMQRRLGEAIADDIKISRIETVHGELKKANNVFEMKLAK